MMAASTLFNYLNWTTKGDSADPLVARITPVLAEPAVTPLMQVWWRTHLSFWHHVERPLRRGGRGDQRSARNRRAVRARRLPVRNRPRGRVGAHRQRRLRRRVGASAGDAASTLAGPSHGLGVLPSSAGQPRAAAGSLRKRGEGGRAGRRRSRAKPGSLRCKCRTSSFASRTAASPPATGKAACARWKTRSPRRPTSTARPSSSSVSSSTSTRRSPPARRSKPARASPRCLRTTGRAGRSCSCAIVPTSRRALPTTRCMQGIETQFVRMLIERNSLDAPPDASPEWPFRLRVRALGGFELTRDGVPMRFAGKAQQRPLDLLKLLIALGGSDVDTQQLTAALWPDSDGDAAKTSFDTTLFRLRKAPRCRPRARAVRGQALARACGGLDRRRRVQSRARRRGRYAQPQGRPAESAAHIARRLLDAYPGPLLGAEEHAWMAKPRDALRARFCARSSRLGERLEHQGDFATAIDVYRRRPRSRQPCRVVLSRSHALARLHRRPGRGP